MVDHLLSIYIWTLAFFTITCPLWNIDFYEIYYEYIYEINVYEIYYEYILWNILWNIDFWFMLLHVRTPVPSYFVVSNLFLYTVKFCRYFHWVLFNMCFLDTWVLGLKSFRTESKRKVWDLELFKNCLRHSDGPTSSINSFKNNCDAFALGKAGTHSLLTACTALQASPWMAGGCLSLSKFQLVTNRCTHLLGVWVSVPCKCSAHTKGGLNFLPTIWLFKKRMSLAHSYKPLRSVKKNNSQWEGGLRMPKGTMTWKIVAETKWWGTGWFLLENYQSRNLEYLKYPPR